MNSSSSMSPAASSFLAFHLMVPDPALSPFQYPFIIGPDERHIAGISTVAAAINSAGVVLSHPIVSTTPSIGYPKRTSTNPKYWRLRSNAAVGRLPVSWIGCTGNSMGMPPFSLIPSRTR